jgi:hypothetical protein
MPSALTVFKFETCGSLRLASQRACALENFVHADLQSSCPCGVVNATAIHPVVSVAS